MSDARNFDEQVRFLHRGVAVGVGLLVVGIVLRCFGFGLIANVALVLSYAALLGTSVVTALRSFLA